MRRIQNFTKTLYNMSSSSSRPVFGSNTSSDNKSILYTNNTQNLDPSAESYSLQWNKSHLGSEQQQQQHQRSPSHFHYAERPSSFASSTISSLDAAQQLPHPQQPPGTLLPGTLVSINGNALQIEKFLAEGGFAHVYLAGSGNSVAKFVLKRISCPDQASLNELIQEAKVHRQLSGHECIVDFFDFSYNSMSQGGGGFELMILMEYCQGGPLVDYLNSRLDNRPSQQEILTIFMQICSAVCHMHSQSPKPITHRDIKIENVLLSNGRFKLCDFGSCTSETSPPNTFLSIQEIRKIEDEISRLTTLQYRAPEMCDLYQKKGLNEKVDIWALGVLLYKLCYYTTPFEESGKMAIMNGSFSFPSHPAYSDEIKNFISAMLQVDVNTRPDIFQVYYHACSLTNTPYPLPNIPRPIQTNTSPAKSSLQYPQQQSLFAGDGPFKSVTKTSSQTDLSGVAVTPMRRGRPSAKKGNSGSNVDGISGGESLVNLTSPTTPTIGSFQETIPSANPSVPTALGFSNDPFTAVSLNQGSTASNAASHFSNPPFSPPPPQDQHQQHTSTFFPNNYTNNPPIRSMNSLNTVGQGSSNVPRNNSQAVPSPFQHQQSQQFGNNTMQLNPQQMVMMNQQSQGFMMNQFASSQSIMSNGNSLPMPPPKPIHLQYPASTLGANGGHLMNSAPLEQQLQTHQQQQQQFQQQPHQQQFQQHQQQQFQQQQFQQQSFSNIHNFGGMPALQMQQHPSFHNSNGVGISFNMGPSLPQHQPLIMQGQQQGGGPLSPPPKPPRQGRSPLGNSFPQK